ncbi:MAG: NAD-dependent epimerase/dehydratase family protein [Anaerocolumna sp.]
MKRVLVIGANSYIGKKFYEYVKLEKKEEILIDMVSASDDGWRKVDLSQYDSILHLAAIVHKKEKKSMKELYYQVNYRLAVEVAKNAKENRVGQFIFMSTAAVYGDGATCITKNTVPKPTTYYGKTKLAAENDINKLSDDKFKVAIIRPPMVYGEGCKGNYAKLEKLAKYTPIFPEYHNKRSAIEINNLLIVLSSVVLEEQYGFFHPQNKEYMDTCVEILKISKNIGKRTVLVKIPTSIIKCSNCILPTFKKMFADCYYKHADYLNF